MIDAEGGKKFLPGGKASGSVFVLGSGMQTYYCEGYATGLSIRAALRSMYSTARVVVCFSAANLAKVAVNGFVVADHDESNTGRIYAEKTRLPYWMPPEVGDANDYHQKHGVRALADALRALKRADAGLVIGASSCARAAIPGAPKLQG
jgi:putative DNA primase/helicase